jgi:hypothetical protein
MVVAPPNKIIAEAYFLFGLGSMISPVSHRRCLGGNERFWAKQKEAPLAKRADSVENDLGSQVRLEFFRVFEWIAQFARYGWIDA